MDIVQNSEQQIIKNSKQNLDRHTLTLEQTVSSAIAISGRSIETEVQAVSRALPVMEQRLQSFISTTSQNIRDDLKSSKFKHKLLQWLKIFLLNI